MTGYEIVGTLGMFIILAGLGYMLWEITREARRP